MTPIGTMTATLICRSRSTVRLGLASAFAGSILRSACLLFRVRRIEQSTLLVAYSLGLFNPEPTATVRAVAVGSGLNESTWK